jgi:FGGY-family pentulose kinase
MGELLVGVDVGTGSARAGVLSPRGVLLGRAEHDIEMRRRSAREAEHDSGQIWMAVAAAVRGALDAAAARGADIAAIGFDATCSLVLRSPADAPVAAGTDGDPRWDTLVWLDHRAMAEAEECTVTGDSVLMSLGGVMSPEMQVPKLLWLKRHLPASWERLGAAYDLVDYLTFRASGSRARSQSSLACKWLWSADGSGGWPAAFLNRMDLADLISRAALPKAPVPPGSDLGPLTPTAAASLGLTPQTRVAAGLIDAHAGFIAMLGAGGRDRAMLDQNLCLIAGTSNSVLALSPEPRPAHGIWGPYQGAILPGLFLLEAGQSATGALLDHLIRWHAAGGEPTPARHAAIAARIAALREAEGDAFAAGLHVLPDFHGNRSPLAAPAALGVISGLGLEADFDSLCRLYWRAALALALGTRQNLEALGRLGFSARRLLFGGGHTRNALLRELYADATGATLVMPRTPDVMLLGAAMLAAVAAGGHDSLPEAMAALDQGGLEHAPSAPAGRYDRDYRILLEMQRQRQVLAELE